MSTYQEGKLKLAKENEESLRHFSKLIGTEDRKKALLAQKELEKIKEENRNGYENRFPRF